MRTVCSQNQSKFPKFGSRSVRLFLFQARSNENLLLAQDTTNEFDISPLFQVQTENIDMLYDIKYMTSKEKHLNNSNRINKIK